MSTLFNIRESKLYQLARSTTLLSGMVPDILIQMNVETELNTNFPREEEDGDATRILINFTNQKGNSILYKITNHDRMMSANDIDHFLNGYVEMVDQDTLPTDPIGQMEMIIMSAMTFAALYALDVEEGSDKTKLLSEFILKSLTSAIYDDPLDVIIQVTETVSKVTGEIIPMITGMWRVKGRI